MGKLTSTLKDAFVLLLGESGRPSNQSSGEHKSIKVGVLLRVGLPRSCLSDLITNGYLEIIENNKGSNGRLKSSDLVRLTLAGKALASQIVSPFPTYRKTQDRSPDLSLPANPIWNKEDGLFLWGEAVNFRFNRPAPNLERVLIALVAHNWQPRMPNPFHPNEKHSATYLLREAIKSWNHSRLGKYIRLHGDGSGTGFFWERLV
jgi:hypothetical protein